ncbi:MAG TPA: peptidase S8, partial [Myxococcales bacterium]|nr:peptidase S8 [Myxococcales bacterium]
MGPFLLSSLVVLAAVIALGTCGSGTPPAPGEADQTALVDADLTQLVVDFKDGTTKALFDALEVGWGIDLEFNSVEGVRSGITLARVEPSRLEALLRLVRADPNVEAAEPLFSYRASFTPNDPQFGRQWNLEMARMREAWDLTRGAGVIVAVIDTGIAYEDHGEFRLVPDLKGAKFAPGYDFVNDDEHANDDHGHGTHVAGTIAQRTHNGEGVAGVAFEATLMPLKVLDANGTGSSADIADAIRWAADHGAKVLNLSLGGGGRSEVLEAAVDYARKKGAVVVCAAGNGGRGVVEYPAAYPGAVAVSAVAPDGKLASYSSWGKEVDLVVPGGDIRR